MLPAILMVASRPGSAPALSWRGCRRFPSTNYGFDLQIVDVRPSRRVRDRPQSKLAALRYLARIDLSFNRDSALGVSRMKRKVLIADRNGLDCDAYLVRITYRGSCKSLGEARI